MAPPSWGLLAEEEGEEKKTRLTVFFARRRLQQLHMLGRFGWFFSLLFLVVSTGPRCLASWPVRTRRTVARGVQENWTIWEMTSLCFCIIAMLEHQCYMLCVSLRCFGYFLRPLHLTVTCSMSFWSTGFWIFLEDDFRKCSYIQHLLVRQWIHFRVSLRGSCISAQCLDRQWIQICINLRCLRIPRNAWIDSGYKFA